MYPDVPLENTGVQFSCNATGSSYHWYYNGEVVVNQTEQSYNISAVTLANQGSYACDVISGTKLLKSLRSDGISLTIRCKSFVSYFCFFFFLLVSVYTHNKWKAGHSERDKSASHHHPLPLLDVATHVDDIHCLECYMTSIINRKLELNDKTEALLFSSARLLSVS